MQKTLSGLTRRSFMRLLGGAFSISSLGCSSRAEAIKKPQKHQTPDAKTNVVLILADDIGYECFGCYGSTQYQTPHIDALAANGTRFTHCYAQPLCTPTRVKLMTGQSNIRNYVNFSMMDPAEKTFGHMMQTHGYTTCIAGKWQLYGTQQYGPEIRGKGVLPGDAGFDQWCLWQVKEMGERYWGPLLDVNGRMMQYDKEKYGPDVCTDFINDFITTHKDKPFFVYYPMILVHDPFTPTPDSRDKTCRDDQKNFEDMVCYMDKLIGKIVKNLEEAGVLGNTLIMFVGDNGTNPKITSRFGDNIIKGGKGKTTDNGIRVPLVASLGKTATGTVCDDLIDMSDFVPTIAEATGTSWFAGLPLDGVSFLPQLYGRKGTPKEARFMYYNPRPTSKKWPKDVRFAYDKRWKLYGDGRLYDAANDPHEETPILPGEGNPEAETAREKLQRLIDSMPQKASKIAAG